jgi:hypothetical protein
LQRHRARDVARHVCEGGCASDELHEVEAIEQLGERPSRPISEWLELGSRASNVQIRDVA